MKAERLRNGNTKEPTEAETAIMLQRYLKELLVLYKELFCGERQILDKVKNVLSFIDLPAFSKRITDLFLMIDEVAFQKLDVRLADKLLSLSNGTDVVATTHQKLSVELGTAREVISRQLQEFQRRGWIEQARGSVSLLDRTKLEKLALHQS